MGIKEWEVKKDDWMLSHFLALEIEETGNTIVKLSKTANICAKEMEANPNARDFLSNIENFKNIY